MSRIALFGNIRYGALICQRAGSRDRYRGRCSFYSFLLNQGRNVPLVTSMMVVIFNPNKEYKTKVDALPRPDLLPASE